MHDPMTVAFEIKNPIYEKTKLPNGKYWKYHPPIVTVWHNDPESDGTDDSCGWFHPRLSDKDQKVIDEIADWDADFPYFSSPYLPVTVVDPRYEYSQALAGDTISFVAAAWYRIAWYRERRKRINYGEWQEILSLAVFPEDNLRAVLADFDDANRVRRFLICVMRAYLRYHRPWYRHPRFHFWHWRFQVHPVQRLKRWLFSRCAGCGKRFSWGYAPTVTGNSDGPRWFRGEENAYHQDCYSAGTYRRGWMGNVTGLGCDLDVE